MRITLPLLLLAYALTAQTLPATTYVLRGRAITPSKIALDASGHTYVAGVSDGRVFLVKLDADLREVWDLAWGGEGAAVSGLAVGPDGDIYVAGETSALDYPVVRAWQGSVKGGSDGFLTRLTPDGGFVYSTYLGGTLQDSITGVAVGADGSAYVGGWTASANFPVSEGAFQKTAAPLTPFGQATTGFVAKFDGSGQRVYSTYLGGRQVRCSGGSSCIPAVPWTRVTAIGVDAAGAAYVGGDTTSFDFPVTAGAFQETCVCSFRNNDLFLTKVDPAGSALEFSTFVAASSLLSSAVIGDAVTAVLVDGGGNLYAIGTTDSPSFPVTVGAYRETFRNSMATDVASFALKLGAAGDRLEYATFLTGARAATAAGLQVDGSGRAWVVGRSAETFATSANAPANGEAYLFKLNAVGTGAEYAARFPAGSADRALALDAAGKATLLGSSGFVWTMDSSGVQEPALFGVANAAGTVIRSTIAPGELVSLYGKGIGPAADVGARLDENGRVATELGGTRVLIGGIAAPLTFAGPDQINAVVPFGFVSGGVPVEVMRGEQRVASVRMSVVRAQPEVFRSGRAAAALNEDGSVNSRENPARPGTVVSVFVSGAGRMDAPITDGEIRLTPLPKPFEPIIVTGIPAEDVLFAGQAPGLVAGAVQINFRLPAQFYAQLPMFWLQTGEHTSEAFSVYVAR